MDASVLLASLLLMVPSLHRACQIFPIMGRGWDHDLVARHSQWRLERVPACCFTFHRLHLVHEEFLVA